MSSRSVAQLVLLAAVLPDRGRLSRDALDLWAQNLIAY